MDQVRDATEALKLPGVVAVLTGEDCKAKMNPCMNFGPATIAQYPLAVDKVRYVGEAVAAVVAESRYLAEDGVDLLEVDYEDLPPVTDPMAAMEPESAVLHEEHGSNIGCERTFEFGDVNAAFAGADLVVEDTLHWGRSAGCRWRPRARWPSPASTAYWRSTATRSTSATSPS